MGAAVPAGTEHQLFALGFELPAPVLPLLPPQQVAPFQRSRRDSTPLPSHHWPAGSLTPQIGLGLQQLLGIAADRMTSRRGQSQGHPWSVMPFLSRFLDGVAAVLMPLVAADPAGPVARGGSAALPGLRSAGRGPSAAPAVMWSLARPLKYETVQPPRQPFGLRARRTLPPHQDIPLHGRWPVRRSFSHPGTGTGVVRDGQPKSLLQQGFLAENPGSD